MRESTVIAYACAWWRPRASTWSYTSAGLRHGLDSTTAAIVDVEAQRPEWLKSAIALAHRLRPGTAWQYSVSEGRRRDRAIASQVARLRPDAVIGVADADLVTSVPTYLYQDMSISLGLDHAGRPGGTHVNLLAAAPARLEALAATTDARLRAATGVFAMSQWLADHLVERTGVSADRVLVTHAGLNSPPPRTRDPERPVEGRLLFVGVDFVRKGGDAVVEAVRLLRSRGMDVRLTVVGPQRWPLPSAPPEGVEFLGSLPTAAVGSLYADHDVFVMPSRFEAYGIAFVEALAAGLPCVARRAYAMPELVTDGVTGRLVAEAEAEEVAEAVVDVLEGSRFHSSVAADVARVRSVHSWPAVAALMVDRIAADRGLTPST